MRLPKYKWDTPFDWLAQKVIKWKSTKLRFELMEMASRVDSEFLMAIYNDEMTKDGYYREINEDGSFKTPKIKKK